MPMKTLLILIASATLLTACVTVTPPVLAGKDTYMMGLGARGSPSISFPLRTVDGWSPRMMQGLCLFSGAGSAGGWNEWNRCLGGRDQG